jgi:hypothetical protein
MVDTAWSETTLDDLETATRAKNDVIEGHAYIVEGDVAMAMWGIVVAKNAEHAMDGNTWGIMWDEDDGLLLIRV